MRRLEKDHYLFIQNPNQLTSKFKQTNDTPLNKLLHRAIALDEEGQLSAAIASAQLRMRLITYTLMGLCFLFGLIVTLFFILKTSLNIYYLLGVILILNAIFIGRSFKLLKIVGRLPFDSLYERFYLTKMVDRHAYAIYLEEKNQNAIPSAMILIQATWCAFLMGLMVACVMAYVGNIERFIWQATLYKGWIKTFVDILYPPYLLGTTPKTLIDKPIHLLYFLLTSLMLYGWLPRLIIALFFYTKIRPFRIDTTLYYYEALLRQLR